MASVADVATGLPPLEQVDCPLCGGSGYKVLFRRRDLIHHIGDHAFQIVRCAKCSFVFVNPRPSPVDIHRFYPPEFYEVELSRESLLARKIETLAARLKVIGSQPPGRLLDIGCQKGEFLWVMRQRGWDVHGVEFSSTPPNLFDVPIHLGPIEEAPFPAASFDMITLWAVLEHVHDPVAVLRQVRRLLRPGGRAFVLVPNFNSVPARFLRHDDVPRHLVMFTKRTFKAAAAAADLRVARWIFGDDIFSGSTRGVLNYVWKLLHGEPIDEIVAQGRSARRWHEFSTQLRGVPSDSMANVDRLDIRLSPFLDRLMNRLHLGFIMTVELVPRRVEA